jgi:hypothetical protein
MGCTCLRKTGRQQHCRASLPSPDWGKVSQGVSRVMTVHCPACAAGEPVWKVVLRTGGGPTGTLAGFHEPQGRHKAVGGRATSGPERLDFRFKQGIAATGAEIGGQGRVANRKMRWGERVLVGDKGKVAP